MSELSSFKRKRGTCKQVLTNFEKYLNGFKDVTHCDEVQAIEIKMRIDKMETNYIDFCEIQCKIEDLMDEEELGTENVERSDFETKFYRNMARAQELYLSYKKHESSSSSCLDGTVKGSSGSVLQSVRLPTIEIPKFSGEYGNWLEFRDTYISLIHSCASISSIQKFHYLRASLEGSAALVISALDFSAANYTVAWSLVCERYDNTRLLVQNHVKAIFSEEPLKKESAESIRRLIDSYTKNLRSLDILGEPTKSWDTLIIYVISTKLDSRTLREWEEEKIKQNLMTLDSFTKFLKNRADLLETIEQSTSTKTVYPATQVLAKNKNINVKAFSATAHPVPNKVYLCPYCKDEHPLYKCDKFSQVPLNERELFVSNNKLCAVCFRSGHNKRVCRIGPCKICKGRHNSLLHKNTEPAQEATTSLSVSNVGGQVLLATAMVKIKDSKNQLHEVRAVLDSGSQVSFMTESLLNKLSLKQEDINFSVTGINNAVSTIKQSCKSSIQSTLNTYQAEIKFLVLPYIAPAANVVVDVEALEIPPHVILADPNFHIPSSLDLLLGADIFWDLLGPNQLRASKNNYPVLQETKLGYIVSGPIGHPRSTREVSCNLSQFDRLQDQLSKFWVVEDIPEPCKQVLSIEEKTCEEHFTKNVSCEKDGRISVAIPLKMPESNLGDSFVRAKVCFLSLERRLQRQAKLKAMYIDFMKEYSDLGHMTKGDIENPPRHSYFLPHHGVLREQRTTTKLRAVFNASATTTSGLSLNDIQMVGPTIQSDLLSILLRFRQHRFVMTGDVEKMYRQVLIHENQRHLQQIIWRDDPSKPLEAYTLNTVTYGTASAPFLAIRSLKYLGDECVDEETRQIINEDFYVDDLITGHNSADGLMRIRKQVTEALAAGCFNLRKFRSNLPVEARESSDSAAVVDLSEHEQSSALGLKWSPSDDQLHFLINAHNPAKITKRVILSTISQVFDPLGLLSCFIVVGKILLQQLWLHKLQWDDPLPREVLQLWYTFITNLSQLNELRIPRKSVCDCPLSIQLHAFSDASKDAYGACLYIRSEDASGNVEVHLLCAKSRVAPLKASTIPRLELCGALAAAKLLDKVLTTTRLRVSKCWLWTDSSVVLGWLKTPPNKLRQYVKNRVGTIQEMTQNHTWRHIPTVCNPADLLSRGVKAPLGDKSNLWWNGPQFLSNVEDTWPQKTFDVSQSDMPEIISKVALTDEKTELFPFSRFSKLLKMKNCMAFVLRFIYNCRNPLIARKSSISHTERQEAYVKLLKLSQIETFHEEYNILHKKQPLPSKNKLLPLSPFIDEDGLLRVGGRIKNGNFDFAKKHPVILTSKHFITHLIFEAEHLRLMHAGPQLLLSSVRDQIWPLGGRNLAKQIVHKCFRCFRLNAQTVRPIMGNLPEQRLEPGYPFQTTGMDYAGPIIALNRRGRGSKTEKVYIAVFVCFTTKAIHLELVSDLSKDSFLSALRRFIARRSKPLFLYSDNGTQFVGAHNELTKFFKNNANYITDCMSQEGIEFKFIPAYTPHMAGLAEAGVKSVKTHLRRVLGEARLVFEDLYTVLVQIESVLNSRPLTALSTDPRDLTPLTPGHFLVGRPLTALPTPKLVNANVNRLTRFERLESLRQHFWARWSKEYIAELQQKTKWRSSKGQLEEGSLVLIKEDSLPPLKWSLGRTVKIYPGQDGVGRVADI